jgi:hypothetical protein
MMRVALVSTEQFEVAVERGLPASVSQLTEMGTKKNEQPREWQFVKCILGGRPFRSPMRAQDATVLNWPGTRILNIADSSALTISGVRPETTPAA